MSNFNFELNNKNKKFLDHFPETLYTYIPDHNDQKPVIHSEVLDLKRQEEGYGIFFTVNGFFGGKRDGNHLKNINAFFCDIDYPDKINKTEEDIRAYKNEITMEMVESGMIPSAIVETKNGLHVYWFLENIIKINELNPEQVDNLKKTYRDIEEAILKKFDGDPGAKDLARVLRVPGTFHQKDPKDPFECKLIHFCADNIYSFDNIRKTFLAKSAPDSWGETNVENAINADVKRQIERDYPKLERPSYIKLLNGEDIPEGMRNKALLLAAHACKEAGWPIEKAYTQFAGYAGLSLRETRKTVRSAFEHLYDFGYNNEVMEAMAQGSERKKLSEITSKVLAKDTKEERDTSNYRQKTIYQTYEMVIAQRYPTLKFKKGGDFYIYDKGLYSTLLPDEVRSIFLREMIKDGLVNYRKVSSVNDKIACFKSLDNKTFTEEQENPNPDIINFKNGFLDISTYKLYQHTDSYLSTTQIPFDYNPEAKCPQWIRFLQDVMMDDREQIKLMQQIAGYCLTADTRYQMAFIFTGVGGNGKGVFTGILKKIVGTRETSNSSLDTLTSKYGLKGIVGKRLNIIDEVSGRYFESSIIKKLIAADDMSIEVKYKVEPLDFKPIVKLLFNVNELPKINDTTPAIYRRFIIVPFDRSFEEKPDISLEHKLTQELTGILNWAIEGLKDLRQNGYFSQGEKNTKAMQAFKSDNSPMVEFITTVYEPTPVEAEHKYAIPFMDMYKDYKQYCLDNGYNPKALSNFSREMSHTRIDGWHIRLDMIARKKMVFGIRRSITMAGDEIFYNDDNEKQDICMSKINSNQSQQLSF